MKFAGEKCRLLHPQPQLFPAKRDGALELGFLVFLIGFLFIGAFGGFEGGEGVAFFGEGDEAGEIFGAGLVVRLPEFALEVGEGAREAGDGLDLDRDGGAELAPFGQVGGPIDDAIADGGPLHDGAVFVFPDLRVAEGGTIERRSVEAELWREPGGTGNRGKPIHHRDCWQSFEHPLECSREDCTNPFGKL